MVWVQIIWFVVTTIISIALSPKPKPPRQAAIDDFQFPTAEEGRPIPVAFGTVDITGPNVLWYGDLSTTKIKASSGFSSSTVGYKYHIGFHIGLCHGPVDEVSRVTWGDKTAWTGSITSNGNALINQDQLFGGKKREGGIVGDFDVAMGDDSQTANDYLVSKMGATPVPAFRGVCSFIWRGGYVGTTSYVKPIAIRVTRIQAGWQGSTWYPEKSTIAFVHMNPAHIIYQLLTDTEWGMGVPTSFLNDASFRAVADTLYDEGFGLSMLWTQEASIEDFLKIVLDHIAGSIALRNDTGEYELSLMRADYDPDDLDEFGPSEIIELTDFQRVGWGNTVNEVTLVYTDPDTGKDTTVTAQDLGNIDAQGGRIPATVELRGIRQHEIAAQVVGRELQARSTPLAQIEISTKRDAWRIPYNTCFKFTWPDRDVDQMIVRVLTINRGTLDDNTITIKGVQDIYAEDLPNYLSTQGNDPDPDPVPTPDDGPDNGSSVVSTTTTAPPSTPADGDRYYVPVGATGAWAGHAKQMAEWDADENTWTFIDLVEGTIIYDQTTGDHVAVQPDGSLGAFGGGGSSAAVDVSFDNSTLGASGVDNVQEAIDYLATVPTPVASMVGYDDATSGIGEGNVQDAIDYLASTLGSPSVIGRNASGIRAYKNAAQTIANATLTALTWPVEDFDTDGYHSTSSNTSRFVAQRDGKYNLGASVRWDTSTSGARSIFIVKNGVTGTRLAASTQAAAANLTQNVAVALELLAGDYVEVYAYQDSGGAVDVVTSEQMTQAWLTRVGVLSANTQIRGATWVRNGEIVVPVTDVYVRFPVGGTLTGWTITTTNGPGTCVIDVWKDTYANFPPTVGDSICNGHKPGISASTKAEATDLSNWSTTTVAAGDVLAFHLESTNAFHTIFFQLHFKENEP